MPNATAVLSVKFQSSLAAEEVMRIAKEHIPLFRQVPGLVQKYYLFDSETESFSGFYLFASEAEREAYWSSELAAGIPARYRVIPESLRIERYQLDVMLRN